MQLPFRALQRFDNRIVLQGVLDICQRFVTRLKTNLQVENGFGKGVLFNFGDGTLAVDIILVRGWGEMGWGWLC